MGKTTDIAWCDSTFNAWIGCNKISPGCKFCYAERETFVRRERSNGRELWGPHGERHRTSEQYWRQPLVWNAQTWWQCSGCRNRITAKLGEDFIHCLKCGSSAWMPTRQRVFVNSLSDVFEDRPDLTTVRMDLYNLIEQTPNLDWLLLSKRIDLAGELLPYLWLNEKWPENVWLGTSVESQEYFYQRVPELMKIPGPIKFLSIEPMLESINILDKRPGADPSPYRVNWIIVGGESGARCRPFNWDWARSIRDECRALNPNIPFFMKQGGGYPDKRDALESIPEDLRIREWPK